jgi:acylphosphatase
MKKRIHIIVSGHTHDVGFRFGVIKLANSLSLTGWVKNIPDNKVEIIAEGEESNLKELINYCKEGPSSARITDLHTEWEEFKGEFETFSIKY